MFLIRKGFYISLRTFDKTSWVALVGLTSEGRFGRAMGSGFTIYYNSIEFVLIFSLPFHDNYLIIWFSLAIIQYIQATDNTWT